jgi:hypothetical protein
MLGIDDPLVWLAYVLSIGSALMCGVYGVIAWNRGDDSVGAEDIQWAVHENSDERKE